jgi:nucleoid DNA-binding protein
MRSMPTFLTALALAVALWASPPATAMNKAELIDAIASSSGLSKADARRALDGFINATTSALKKGDRISLIGFGSFGVSKRTTSANACASSVDVDFYPAVTFDARKKEEGGRHTPFHNRIARILPQADGTFWVVGPNNAADFDQIEYKDSLDCHVHKRPGRNAPPSQGLLLGYLTRTQGGGETSYEILENGAGKRVAGVVVGGVSRGDLQIGGYVETLPPTPEDDPIGPCPDDGFPGAVSTDGEIFKAMLAETRIPEDRLAAAYNTLLDTIIAVVNAGDVADLGPEFGAFAEETVITASVADDPCAGIPENCPPDGTAADTVYPYIEFDVSAQTGAFSEQELAGLKDTIAGIAKAAARTGRNPQTGKEIKIAAKSVVKFKAGAELAKKVN